MQASAALNVLVTQLDHGLQEVALQPGDLLLIENYIAVHVRSPSRAAYDGTDRRLKRISVTLDLRRSRDLRATAVDPIIN